MIFKRRDPKPTVRAMAEFMWPRGGWTRAFHYVKRRMRRLPDTPERIARGIWAGVFTTFTPFYGMHFIVAALVSRVMRGNLLAALMGTFFGNPLTYVPIGLSSLSMGHWILGSHMRTGEHRSFGGKFFDAGHDLLANFVAIFTSRDMDWSGLEVFWHQVFYPYLIEGIVPGMICATIAYYLAVPLLRAYQKRRKGAIKAKFDLLKKKASAKAEAKRKAEQAALEGKDHGGTR